ncbi:MAG TPA: zf-HC2 domain-containing protein [Gemmatimonadaceae bacterium]|nr:zf-HC2 domain-containing protein [Gemmatimonadaceae bacterium]
MNNCTNSEIQELLPDLEHGRLTAATRQSVEEHLAGCESCREDLRIIRVVKGAAVFEPSIDVDRVVRQIPPYRMPSLPREAPARTRVVQWLVAATVGALLIGAGAMLKSRQTNELDPRVPLTVDSSRPMIVAESVPAAAPGLALPQVRHTPALSLVADVQELSDGNLQQLMEEMDDFDALPNSEPEPVFAVDNGEGR